MAELYTCEICERIDLATEEDELWYNIKNKHFNTLLTLCWNCTLKQCCYCSEDGTWYQKYEMCLCDSCYNQKIKKKCITLGCESSSTNDGGGVENTFVKNTLKMMVVVIVQTQSPRFNMEGQN